MEATIQKGVAALAGLVRWVRGERVMLDADLAALYGVETRALNRAVRRNARRFPSDFMFLIANEELVNLMCQIGTSSLGWGGRRKPVMAFTEQGVAMLSSVLRSDRAADVNIAIMRTFVQLRKLMDSNRELARKISEMEKRYDEQFRTVFQAIQQLIAEEEEPRRRIGF
ncbi:MAG: ORF6N domain-containing protein [Verrucomicrobia bacterium]|nr:ORF6N domain-containing protein [Verrucomicrobiota bacterium]